MNSEILYYTEERAEPHYRDCNDECICPFCGSKDITLHAPDWDDERIDIPHECDNCKREWYLLKKLEVKK